MNLPIGAAVFGIVTWFVVFGFSCATQQIEPPPPLPEVPQYLEVPHPEGTDLQDLRAIFNSTKAPPRDELSYCDKDFKILQEKTQSQEELHRGAAELVKAAPVDSHWCFYWKIGQLLETLKETDLQSQRQQKVVQAFEYLAPVALAFREQFQDTRYLRIAIERYIGISQWVFYRSLEVTPQMTQELVLTGVANPFATYREPAPEGSVLEKYGIEVGEPKIFPQADRQPAAELAPAPPPLSPPLE